MNFDTGKGLLIFEEPERNLHPQLMSRLVEMANETATNRQIIITTHTPEMIRHAQLESLHFIKRSNDGFSCISKPSDSKSVKDFLDNQIGLDELFIQNLLED